MIILRSSVDHVHFSKQRPLVSVNSLALLLVVEVFVTVVNVYLMQNHDNGSGFSSALRYLHIVLCLQHCMSCKIMMVFYGAQLSWCAL